jgi:hypothetical protein
MMADRPLARIAFQPNMNGGIGSNMLCLGLPPLPVGPFSFYNNLLGSDRDRKEGDAHP